MIPIRSDPIDLPPPGAGDLPRRLHLRSTGGGHSLSCWPYLYHLSARSRCSRAVGLRRRCIISEFCFPSLALHACSVGYGIVLYVGQDRARVARVVSSDGRIVWIPHRLLLPHARPPCVAVWLFLPTWAGLGHHRPVTPLLKLRDRIKRLRFLLNGSHTTLSLSLMHDNFFLIHDARNFF